MPLDPLVLLVDDDRADCSELAAVLWSAGYRAPSARSADELLLLLQQLDPLPPRALVMAVEFDGNRGGDWLAELSRRPSWREVPVIAITHNPGSVFAAAVGRMGVPVVSKPIEVASFHTALGRIGCPPGAPLDLFRHTAALILRTAWLRRRHREAVALARELRGPKPPLGRHKWPDTTS